MERGNVPRGGKQSNQSEANDENTEQTTNDHKNLRMCATLHAVSRGVNAAKTATEAAPKPYLQAPLT